MSFAVQGWCPGALRPMMSGDGLVLRIRPHGGRLLPDQARLIADLSQEHGNGLIDLTSRANMQLRGLDQAGHRAVIDALSGAGLIDATAQAESQRNVILSPFAPVDGPAWRIAAALSAALTAPDAPRLPAKFGFAVDDGPPRLLHTPCDIRLIPGNDGLWQIRPDGGDWSLTATEEDAADTALALARWFLDAGGAPDGRGRMRGLLGRGPDLPAGVTHGPAPAPAKRPVPGQAANGWLVGFAFGQLMPGQLRALASAPIRLTPWRALLVEGAAQAPAVRGAIRSGDDPILRVDACSGAMRCPQGLGETRLAAREWAAALPAGRSLHISGCAKGCARQRPADLTLIATGADRWDVVVSGTARDPAARHDVAASDIPALLNRPLHEIAPEKRSRAMLHEYETDGARIYAQSFATIRAEADLARFSPEEEPVVVRMIHAAGLVGLERDVVFSPGMATAARAALENGAPILCDARMVSEGITRPRLPADNQVICTLNDPGVPELARQIGNTRSAAALELWRPHLDGAVVAIGNAPTALFHLLNMLADPDCPRPAAIIGCPVGFVGAAESKDALIAAPPVPALIVRGRLGGSAITVAAVNALASRKE